RSRMRRCWPNVSPNPRTKAARRLPPRCSATRACAARGGRGFGAPQGNRGESTAPGAPRLWRATSRSRRWARSACWRGRTGFTTGGRDLHGIARRFNSQTATQGRVISQRRPRESGDPYAAASRLARWLTASAPTNCGGYGSLGFTTQVQHLLGCCGDGKVLWPAQPFEIYRLHAGGRSQNQIASALDRARSTISRELRRNSQPSKVWTGGYE